MIKLIRFLKNNYFYFIALIIGVLVFDYNEFIQKITDIPINFKLGTVFHRYSIMNEETWLQFVERSKYYFEDIVLWFKEFDMIVFLSDLIRIINDILLYGINYGFNVLVYLYFFFYLFMTKDVYETKYSRGALAFIKFMNTISYIKQNVIHFISYLRKNLKKIFLSFCIYFLFQSFLISFISETLIFIYYYVLSSANLNLHIILYEVLKSIILFVYIKIPLWIIILFSIYMIWKYALYRAEIKKQKNHDQLKVVCKYVFPFFTIINGLPGIGKTRFMVAAALATEENYIDEIEETVHQIEIDNPTVNFAEIIKNPYKHQLMFPEHYEYYKYLKRETSFILSTPFSILDPYSKGFSHQLDMDYLRPNNNSFKAALQKYTILVWSELDKEYNSHYNTKEVGEDGVYITFGIGSHWLERLSKIFADYQITTQVPLNIRGNAEMVIHIDDKKYKMPFLLNLFSLPFKWFYSIVDNIIMNYESYKLKLFKHSNRTSKRLRKRYDYTALYSFFRYISYYNSKILSFFDKFSYMKYYISVKDTDGKTIDKMKININSIDEQFQGSRLYDSTFLSFSYKEKQNEDDYTDFDKIPLWSSLSPSRGELEKIHSNFINKSMNINTEQNGVDDYDEIKTRF